MSAVARELRRTHSWSEWLAFTFQVLIAISIEVGDDIGRGLFSQHGTAQGIHNARQIMEFESAHGLWIEPAWQSFFEHTHQILAFHVSWHQTAQVMNAIYVFGHVGVTLSVAIWVYMYRRQYFAFLRNIIIFTNLFALFVYESYPVAPPRLVGVVSFEGHPFAFYDTLYGLVNTSANLAASHTGYNEFSAMPSVHMAWALVAGGAVLILARHRPVKVLGALYPVIMLVAVVVTANHFVLDAAGAAAVVLLAICAALAVEWGKQKFTMSMWRPIGTASGESTPK